MTFVNEQVDLSQIPNADEVAWQPLDSKYRIAVLIEGLLAALLVLAATLTLAFLLNERGIATQWLPYIVAGAVALSVVHIAVNQLAINYCGFAVREHDVLYKSGMFLRTRTVVPINRIQHVEIASGPLDRQFQIARLQLYTAGTAGGDLMIRGLSAKVADALRRYLLKRATQQHAAAN